MPHYPSDREKKEIASKIIEYYSLLFPKERFEITEEIFFPEQIGEFIYTYPGEYIFGNIKEAFKDSKELAKHGITPAIIAIKKSNNQIYVLDGHIRALTSYVLGIAWKVFLIKTGNIDLGLEEISLGKVKNMQKYIF